MKAILEFNMDDQDDRSLHKSMLQSRNLECAMWDFAQQTLRKYRKYGVPNEVFDELELGLLDVQGACEAFAAHIESKFYAALSEHDATIED